MPKFTEFEEKVQQDWINDQREQLYEKYIAGLMESYDVTIEEVPVEELPGVAREQAK